MMIKLAFLTAALAVALPAAAEPTNRTCMPCDLAVPASVRTGPLKGSTATVPQPNECSPACIFTWPDGTNVNVSVTCDDDQKEYRKPGGFVKGTVLERVGKGAYTIDRPNGKTARIWDDDTACSILNIWTKPKSDEAIVALARALVASTTPASVSSRKTIEAVVWAADESGAAAKAALARWPQEQKALSELVQIAAGFPRAIELPAAAGAKARKALLIGECGNAEAKTVVEALAVGLPGIKFERLPADHAAVSCPAVAQKPVADGVVLAKVGPNHLGLIASQQGPTATAFLRGPDGRLLDSKVVALNPRGLAADTCTVAVKPGKGATALTTECTDPGQLRGRKCKEGAPDRYVRSTQIAAKDARIEVTDKERMEEGKDCVELR